MLFKYKATTPEGQTKDGTLEAPTVEIAVSALQKRSLIVISIKPMKEKESFFEKDVFSFERIKRKDVVLLSRKISTLFEAKVPMLISLKLLASETEKKVLRVVLDELISDVEGGAKISAAMARHPKVFSAFYINMVRAGEESGKLDEVFQYLADYLERSHELSSKATRALIYPAFVISAFIGVMVLMMVVVVPKMGDIIKESGQEPPFYTQIVLSLSNFLKSYGLFVLIFIFLGIFLLWRYSRTKAGRFAFSKFVIGIPFLGVLYKKLYQSRIADTMETLITGGVSMVRSLEITAEVVENESYKNILVKSLEAVKGGVNLSTFLAPYDEISPLFSQMLKIGEESGKLSFVLKTVATYYKKEVDQELDTLVSLIEPAMIVVLGVGVGFLLAAVLIPIYNIALSV